MKAATQAWRTVRLFGFTFAHAAWPAVAFGSLSWPTRTAVIGASVAASEAAYRQLFPAGKKGLVANLVATYRQVAAAAKAAPPAV